MLIWRLRVARWMGLSASEDYDGQHTAPERQTIVLIVKSDSPLRVADHSR
jgi:hypothetical protein